MHSAAAKRDVIPRTVPLSSLAMRLKPGVSLERAQAALREALNLLMNAQSGQRYESAWQTYAVAIDQALPHLAVFAEPSLADALLSPTYWHLFPIAGIGPEANRVVYRELRTQIEALERAEAELEKLKQYAEHPGAPVVLDTNILNWWDQPHTINWQQLFKDEGIVAPLARLVVPLVVIEELDPAEVRRRAVGQTRRHCDPLPRPEAHWCRPRHPRGAHQARHLGGQPRSAAAPVWGRRGPAHPHMCGRPRPAAPRCRHPGADRRYEYAAARRAHGPENPATAREPSQARHSHERHMTSPD